MFPAVARAREMAIYNEQVTRPYVRRIEEQAEQIGRLSAELEHTRREAERERAERERVARDAEARVHQAIEDAAEARAAAQAEAMAAATVERRPWWRALLGG